MKNNIILLVVSYFYPASADVPDAALAGLWELHNSDSQLITIHRDYRNAYYNWAALQTIQKLQLIQNAIAQLLPFIHQHEYAIPMFWLSIGFWMSLKMLV